MQAPPFKHGIQPHGSTAAVHDTLQPLNSIFLSVAKRIQMVSESNVRGRGATVPANDLGHGLVDVLLVNRSSGKASPVPMYRSSLSFSSTSKVLLKVRVMELAEGM
jgi:hypothetical protein